MPRTLKTYVTNLGFFELALAAPSMKAALEAWGLGHNAFQHGFAKQTQDAAIIAATMAKPGTVLRRPVGSKGAFQEQADLRDDLWKRKPPKPQAPKSKAESKPRKPQAAKASAGQADPAPILSFAKAKARRDAARLRDEKQDAARHAKDKARIARAQAKADQAMARAKARHDANLAAIAQDRDALDRREAAEKKRWEAERARLEAAQQRAAR
jgi:hypothetical protein